MGCEEDTPEVVLSEEQPGLDMGDTETEEVSPYRKPGEEPFNMDTCPSSGLGS